MIEIFYTLQKKLLSNDSKAISGLCLGEICTPFSKEVLFGFQPDLKVSTDDIIAQIKNQNHVNEQGIGQKPTPLQMASRKRLMAELAFAKYVECYEKYQDLLGYLIIPYRDNELLLGKSAKDLIEEIDKAEAKEYKNG